MDEESYKLPQSIQFQRAARTDKGVSVVPYLLNILDRSINYVIHIQFYNPIFLFMCIGVCNEASCFFENG